MTKPFLTRQFRKKPFCWQEKAVLRLLRRHYGKRKLSYRRAVYLALTEIESDFEENFVKNYTKTIATYAGVDRHLASKILREFEGLGIIEKLKIRDEKGKFVGQEIHLLECPVAGIPPVDSPPDVNAPHEKLSNNNENSYDKNLKTSKLD